MSRSSHNRNNNDLFKNHSEDATWRQSHYSPKTIFIYFSFNIIKKIWKFRGKFVLSTLSYIRGYIHINV